MVTNSHRQYSYGHNDHQHGNQWSQMISIMVIVWDPNPNPNPEVFTLHIKKHKKALKDTSRHNTDYRSISKNLKNFKACL